MPCDWQPSASIVHLQQRAKLMSQLRTFFSERGVWEVDTPVLGAASVSDPHIEALSVAEHYLQTSPEYFMKRLLAAGSGAIYYLGKAFRRDEAGARHNPEFTMLEWYRPKFDDHRLIDELVELIRYLKVAAAITKISYGELFERHTGLNPHTASAAQFRQLAAEKLDVNWPDDSISLWLDLLFSHLVEPQLNDAIYLVYDYPACQKALAKTSVNAEGVEVAHRFEMFWQGIEVANGYWELTDAAEQRKRFNADNQTRCELSKPIIAPDEKFLAALDAGLPECAGVALGVDRLLMCLLEQRTISSVLPFSYMQL